MKPWDDMDSIAVDGSAAARMRAWLAAQPLVPVAVGLILGIALDSRWPLPIFLVVALFALAGVATVLMRSNDLARPMLLLLAALSVGAARHDLAVRHWPSDHIVQHCPSGFTLVRLTGTVLTPPVIAPVSTGKVEWIARPPRTRMLLSAESLATDADPIPVRGTVGLTVREPVAHVVAGDRVEIFGSLYRPGPPANPGALDYSLVSHRRGVLVRAVCNLASHVQPRPGPTTMIGRVAQLRRWFRSAMLEDAYDSAEPGAEVLSSMILGQRSAVSRPLNEAFTTVGVIHYLSVSGAHVGMLAGVVWLIGMAAGASRRTCAGWVLLIITAYGLLAEPRPPIWRAVIVGNLACTAILLRRPIRSANWLALAAIILLMVRPTQVFEPGFQLSFLTVLALLFVALRAHTATVRFVRRLRGRDDPLLQPPIQDMLNPPSRMRLVGRAVTATICVWLSLSLWAWIASAPIVAYHFHRLSVWGWFNNLLVFPLVWVTQILGVAKTVFSALIPPLGALMGAPLRLVTDTLVDLVSVLSRMPGAVLPTPAVPLWVLLAVLFVALLWLAAPKFDLSSRSVGLVALALASPIAWVLAPRSASDDCVIDVLSVGPGAACVIHLPEGRSFAYDMGTMSAYDLYASTIERYLAHERVPRLDAVILSHAHLDHYSAIPDLAAHRRVGRMFVPPHFLHTRHPGGVPRRLRTILHELNVRPEPIQQSDQLTGTGSVFVEVLWPPPVDAFPLDNANDTSLVLRISYAGRRVLLCGDIGPEPQRALIASTDLKADVLLLPHHGSIDPTTADFIAAVDPIEVVRSGGHAGLRADPLAKLLQGRRSWDTAVHGAVRIRLTPDSLDVTARRMPRVSDAADVDPPKPLENTVSEPLEAAF